MKVEETPNEITIKETPGCIWLFGLFFIIISGTFIYGIFGGFSNWHEIPTWQLVLTFFGATAILSCGVWIISNAPITNVSINRLTNTVSMKQYGFFGKRDLFYKFEDIKGFCLIEDKDSEGDLIWTLGMNLENGETVKISSVSLHIEDVQRKYVFQINEFMRKEIPSYKNLQELDN